MALTDFKLKALNRGNPANSTGLDVANAVNETIDEVVAQGTRVDTAEKNAQDVVKVSRANLIAQGLSGNYGFFVDGFSYTQSGDVGIDNNGTTWEYVGANPLPFNVPAGTVPSNPDYEEVEFNNHNSLEGRSEVNSHPASAISTSDASDVQTKLTSLENDSKTDQDVKDLALQEIISQWGYTYKGTFTEGFTITTTGDVGVTDSGQVWRYVGSDPLPLVVAAGTVPSEPDWGEVRFDRYARIVDLTTAISEDMPVDTVYMIRGSHWIVVESADVGGFYETGMVSGRKLKLIDVDNFYAYGIVNDNTIDQKSLLQSYANLAIEFYIPETYSLAVTSTVEVNHGNVNVAGRLQALEGSPFTGDEVLKIGSYNATQIGSLNNSLSVGFSTVTIPDTSILSVGDIVTIYNPTDFSWSDHRNYYRQGEHLKVAEIVNSTQFRSTSNIFDDYPSGIPVYSLNAKKCNIKALNVHAGELTAYAATIESLADGEVNNLTCTGGRVATIHRNRCYGLKFNNPSSQQWYNDGSATNYAHYTLSCQNVVDYNPNVRAFRHAIALTARDQELSIPNRNCGAISGVATCTNSTAGVTALDFHGCTESCFYLDIEINGGVNIGGKNNKVRSDKIYQRSHTSCIYGGELVNINHDYSDCTIITSQAGANSRGQWIDIGGNSPSLDANTKEGGILDFRNLKVECLGNPNSSSDTIKITNRGYSGDDIEINLDGLKYEQDASFNNWVRFLIGRVDSGSYLNRVSIKNATVNNMAVEITANNINTDGYFSSGSSNLVNNYVGLRLLPINGVCDLGDVTVVDASLSPIEINGALGGASSVVVSSSISCMGGNQSAGGTTEENSGFSVRSVDTAVIPELNVSSSSVDPAATLSVRVNNVNKVVRGHWSFAGYTTSTWSATNSGFDDCTISQFKIDSTLLPPATTLGSVTNKIEVRDQDGNSIGFVPIYDNIS